MVRAFEDLLDATASDCDIGLLISEPDEGHQALNAAERLYVYFSEGSRVSRYVEEHPDQYLVFITSSHDTRFDGYGKISSEGALGGAVSSPTDDAPDEEPLEPEPGSRGINKKLLQVHCSSFLYA